MEKIMRFRLDSHLARRAFSGLVEECGDTGIISNRDESCTVALIDVLGHGKGAAKVAVRAREFLEKSLQKQTDHSPVQLIHGLHDHLKGSRGAVGAICRIETGTGTMAYSGMGNITIKIYGRKNRTLLTKEGIIGYIMSSPTEQEEQLRPGDTVIITSDGIPVHFDPALYPDLLIGTAKQVADNLLTRLAKDNDDASCIVLKYTTV